MAAILFSFAFGVIVGGICVCIYQLQEIRQFWRRETLGMTDFDIKCINEEYARRCGND